jgi:hypothetical protein
VTVGSGEVLVVSEITVSQYIPEKPTAQIQMSPTELVEPELDESSTHMPLLRQGQGFVVDIKSFVVVATVLNVLGD